MSNFNKYRSYGFFILTFMGAVAYGQVEAITEYGDTIYVYDNGTWSFEPLDESPEIANELSFLSETIKLDTIFNDFKVDPGSTKQIEGLEGMFTINYDSKIWKRVPPATLNEDADYAFQAKNSDIWSVVIAEETPIDKEKLFLIAKKTMKEGSGSDPLVIKTELRTVNGTQVVRGVMKADFSGIGFIFDTYFYSNENGSVQFVTWTADKIWEKNKEEILKLLNGFVVKK